MNDSLLPFKGKATCYERADELTQSKLGNVQGSRSDGLILFAAAGWCKLQWLSDHEQAVADGMPSIALPTSFQIVKAK